MQPKHFFKAFILALCIVVVFVLGWEYYWRSKGFRPSYNDDKVLWTQQRKKADQPADRATVFIGGSRNKFDVDLPTWEKLTGEEAIQLALVGTPPRLTLRDLANDAKFKGKLVIDVTELQFFSMDTVRRERSAREAIEYYHKETPSQKVSASIDLAIESKLVLLEEGKFGLGSLLNTVDLPNRSGVVFRPPVPKELAFTYRNRQTAMTPMFLADTLMQNRQKEFWMKSGIATIIKQPRITGDTLTNIFRETKMAIDKIRSRGGQVIFVRPPSGGKLLEGEEKIFPRQKYWEQLLLYTGTQGIHYADYPVTAKFNCPEWSHLSPTDAVIYTEELVRILQEDKGWVFPHKTKPGTVASNQ